MIFIGELHGVRMVHKVHFNYFVLHLSSPIASHGLSDELFTDSSLVLIIVLSLSFQFRDNLETGGVESLFNFGLVSCKDIMLLNVIL